MWSVLATGAVAGQSVDLTVTVYVSSFAQVPGTVLVQARGEAGRIYRAAGIALDWVDCATDIERPSARRACQTADSQQNWLAVRLVSRSRMDGLHLRASVTGLAAVPTDGGFGHVAFLCTECAEEALTGRPYSHGAIIGGLIAHEIGHLLLNRAGHSASGLMRSPWTQEEWELAAQGRMVLNHKEAQQIRAQVQERMQQTTQTRAAR